MHKYAKKRKNILLFPGDDGIIMDDIKTNKKVFKYHIIINKERV